uniref:Peptidase S54 rhomboid domain-containing protein n=2 Tax=Clytia hemisphaerica TaxID=252671 RepID=A0A7M5V7F1_9CNID
MLAHIKNGRKGFLIEQSKFFFQLTCKNNRIIQLKSIKLQKKIVFTMPRTQAQRRGGLGLLLLGSQIMQIGVDRIPPVTLLTVALNAAIYLRVVPGLPSVHSACTSNNFVFKKKEWKRLFLSSFYHLDDMHLYFNMVSFIWKGMKLEQDLGRRKFISLLAVFSVATQLMMLGLNHSLYLAFKNQDYLFTCAAGFSAVLFALKVLTTASSDGNQSVMGLPIVVPTRYACWVELVLIQILVPNASFTGHLAGILVGLLYVYGPLKPLVKILSKIVGGYRQSSANTRNNGMQPNSRDDEDEQLQRAIRESLRQQRNESTPPPYGWHIPENSPPTNRPSGNRNNLYPNLNDRTFESASAPPADVDGSDLPYPSSNDGWNAPYPPPQDHEVRARRPLNERHEYEPSNSEDIRNARLRRFENRN